MPALGLSLWKAETVELFHTVATTTTITRTADIWGSDIYELTGVFMLSVCQYFLMQLLWERERYK